MSPQEFCYWLQGFFELRDDHGGPTSISAAQAECIQKHLALVFENKTGTAPAPIASPQQEKSLAAALGQGQRSLSGHHLRTWC